MTDKGQSPVLWTRHSTGFWDLVMVICCSEGKFFLSHPTVFTGVSVLTSQCVCVCVCVYQFDFLVLVFSNTAHQGGEITTQTASLQQYLEFKTGNFPFFFCCVLISECPRY